MVNQQVKRHCELIIVVCPLLLPTKLQNSHTKYSHFHIPTAKRGGDDNPDKRDPPPPTSLPLLILTDGSMLLDAWDIATHCGLETIPEEFRVLLEDKLAPLTRHLLYHYLLKHEHVMTGLMTEHNHIGFNTLWSLGNALLVRVF